MNKKILVSSMALFFLMTSCADRKELDSEDKAGTTDVLSMETTLGDDSSVNMKYEGPVLQEESAPAITRMASKGVMNKHTGVRNMAYMPSPVMGGQQGFNQESYDSRTEKGFISVGNDPLSTFSIDVDTASYANIRRFVTDGSLPPVGAVRVEEMINYFNYDYPQPVDTDIMTISTEIGTSPFNSEFSLVRIGVQAKDIAADELPPSNLVFLVDVSGSMEHPNKLPLLKQSLKMLTKTLGENDRVSMVVYAGADRIALEPTSGTEKKLIVEAIDKLSSGGSTHGSKGILSAYKLAKQSFIPGGNNRVVLASDGDFNVGVTSRGELVKLIEKERESGVYLTVLGLGMGNFHDDTMEILADKGNGNYAYIDSLLEAKKVMVKERGGTFFTLANDVKIQVEFNPSLVGAYRLIGYENRALADEDFKDDKKDAGEIGAGHTVTALYELIPAGHELVPEVDELKYQKVDQGAVSDSSELMTVKLRYKAKGESVSKELVKPVMFDDEQSEQLSEDYKFASAVAGFGMLLTDSDYVGEFNWEKCLELIREGRGLDENGYRAEFMRIVEKSQLIYENK